MSEDNNSNQEPAKDIPEVAQELSQVATNPKKNMLILGGIFVVFAYLFFNLFISGDDSDKKEKPVPMPKNVTKPVETVQDNDIPAIPTLPTPPKLEDPVPPAPPEETEPLPPAPEPLPELPIAAEKEAPQPLSLPSTPSAELLFGGQNDEETIKRTNAKRKSSMMLISGTPNTQTPEQIHEAAGFTHRGDLHLVLGHGKMLDAIIESAVNTDIGGEIRGVISRDVYSEWGKNILIPKGSRIIGNYSTGIDGSYGRISIEWTRVDLASGYTLNLSSTTTDHLGRKGTQGRVDNKFKERFSNAVMRSAFNVALAKGLDSLVEPATSTTAAATLNQTASNVKTIATGILTGTTYTALSDQITQICTQTQDAIKDKTLPLYTTIKTACDNNEYTTENAKLTAVVNAVNSGSDTLVQGTTANTVDTKAQAATKQAFTDVSDVVKTLVEEQKFSPTITIDQGTPIKIYVNKDYAFPKAALPKARKSR